MRIALNAKSQRVLVLALWLVDVVGKIKQLALWFIFIIF